MYLVNNLGISRLKCRKFRISNRNRKLRTWSIATHIPETRNKNFIFVFFHTWGMSRIRNTDAASCGLGMSRSSPLLIFASYVYRCSVMTGMSGCLTFWKKVLLFYIGNPCRCLFAIILRAWIIAVSFNIRVVLWSALTIWRQLCATGFTVHRNIPLHTFRSRDLKRRG